MAKCINLYDICYTLELGLNCKIPKSKFSVHLCHPAPKTHENPECSSFSGLLRVSSFERQKLISDSDSTRKIHIYIEINKK